MPDLFEKLNGAVAKEPKGPYVSRCPICGDYGYTGCDGTKNSDGSDRIAVALGHGKSCICEAGVWFSEQQKVWCL